VSAQIVRREPTAPVHRVSAAQQRAGRIRDHLAGAAEEYATAVLEGDWDVLGYGDVAAWAADQFGQHKFTPDARRQVAALLAARGKTVRQIAAATGVHNATAARDARAGAANRSTSSSRQQAATRREERKRQEEDERLAVRVREEQEHAFMAGIPPQEQEDAAVQIVAEQVAAEPDSAPEPQPCPRCAHLEQELADRSAELEKAHRRIAALSAEVARRSGDADRAAEPDPPVAAQPEPEAADPAHGDEQDPAQPGTAGLCGSAAASKVIIVVDGTRQRVMAPGGEELEWLCREHRALLADRAGAAVMLAPGGEDFLSFDTGTCQWPAEAEVSA
jgi:hypothetical protein